MPKIKVTVNHSLGGGKDVYEGEILDVTENEAKRKVAMGFAAHVDEAPASSGMTGFTPPAEPEE